MPPYQLTAPAEEDLREIARYTRAQWGERQSLRYAGLLEKRFREIAAGTSQGRIVLERWPNLRVSRCEHHYIFYLLSPKTPPIIIAVLHERMDLLQRLKRRLD